MANDLRRGFMTDEPAPEPQGGLASRAMGGLSKFLGDVNRGIEVVMSSPLYQRAWSGFVSGQTGDPLAGPMALEALKQSSLSRQTQRMENDWQQTQMDRENEAYTNERQLALLRQKQTQELQDAMAAGDRTRAGAAYAALDPEGAAKLFLAPPAAAQKPVQVMRDGKPVYVSPADAIGMEPVPRAPLVTVENGMKPEQVIMAEDRAAGRVDEKAKPLEVALDAYRAFRALADKVAASGRPPTAAETDSLSKLAARLENPEAVQEGDIARKAGGSFANFFAGKAGLPYTLSLDQLAGLVSTADTIAAAKRQRLDEIYAGAKGVAQGRGFNPEAVTPGAQPVVSAPVQPPQGFRPHPTVPGLFVNDAGEGWVP